MPPTAPAEAAARAAALKEEYARLEQQLVDVATEASRVRVTLQAADGAEKELPVLDVYRAYPANRLTTCQRVRRVFEPGGGVSRR